MKRSGPLPRRVPLRGKSEMPRSAAPIQQKAPAKPGAASAEKLARAAVLARSQGLCEIRREGVCDGQATDWSHRIARSQRGPWAASNGLASCRSCHAWCHANPQAAKSWGWQLSPVYKRVDRNRVLRPAAEFPAYICRPAAWQPEWYWLHDDGTVTLTDFFELAVDMYRLPLPHEGGGAAA